VNRLPLVLDACLIITFGSAGRLDLLSEAPVGRVIVAARACAEVKRPPARDLLRQAVSEGRIHREAIDLEQQAEQEAFARFNARPAFRDRGEAEVLSLALTRNYIVGSDERPVRTAAIQELGRQRVAGSLDILIWAIRDRRLSLAEAEDLINELDSGDGVRRMLGASGKSLTDLL
jgi:predicted nucleic acid-binding protein